MAEDSEVQALERSVVGALRSAIHDRRREGVLLTDAQANEIRLGLALGIRGPVLIKWCGQLLADRDARRARESPLLRPWPGPLAGPPVSA